MYMAIEKIIRNLIIIILMVWAYIQGGFFGCLGMGSVCFVAIDFLCQKKSWLPIGELALLLGGLQWIISPFFSYQIDSGNYSMSQTCSDYMMFTVPMYMAFMLGYYKFRHKMSLDVNRLIDMCRTAKVQSDLLIFVGLLFMFLPIKIPALLFIKTLASYLFFIGFIFRMYMKPRNSTVYLILSLGIQLLNSIRGGMFHELLVWGVFMLMTWFNVNQTSLKKRLLIFLFSLIGVFMLQTVKSTYRQAIWYNDYSGNKIELFLSLFVNNVMNINSINAEQKETAVVRYNQGWIISRIYNNIPQNHDYFYGRTYLDALKSAALPRALFPDKKGAGEQSRNDFIEMTGYQLSTGTSMGLSILGESYGNFGLFGGMLFMAFWGWFIAKIVSIIDNLSKRNYMWILFLPIICFNLVKAEISMMSVLNWTIKSIIFVMGVIYILRPLKKE